MTKSKMQLFDEWREGNEYILALDEPQRDYYNEAVAEWMGLLRGIFSGSELCERYLADPTPEQIHVQQYIREKIGPLYITQIERAAYYRLARDMSSVKWYE